MQPLIDIKLAQEIRENCNVPSPKIVDLGDGQGFVLCFNKREITFDIWTCIQKLAFERSFVSEEKGEWRFISKNKLP